MTRYVVMLRSTPEDEHSQNVRADILGTYRWRWVARLKAFWNRSGTNRVWIVDLDAPFDKGDAS